MCFTTFSLFFCFLKFSIDFRTNIFTFLMLCTFFKPQSNFRWSFPLFSEYFQRLFYSSLAATRVSCTIVSLELIKVFLFSGPTSPRSKENSKISSLDVSPDFLCGPIFPSLSLSLSHSDRRKSFYDACVLNVDRNFLHHFFHFVFMGIIAGLSKPNDLIESFVQIFFIWK